jgi:AcrR family transcriptional regulator
MALLTQKAIWASFEEMLVEMPFDKITVSALVKRCEVSSNTFYYHYQDIFAELDTLFNAKLGKL